MVKILAIIGAVVLGALGASLLGLGSTKAVIPQPPLMSLQNMGHLATVKVNYANVIEFSEKSNFGIPTTQWELHFGGAKVLLVARGDCLIATDIRKAKYLETNESNRTATLLLPIPKAISARVNHEPREKGGSYFSTLDTSGVAPLMPGSEHRTKAIEGALKVAQQEVEVACKAAEVIETAKKNTETVLKPAFTAIGWNVNFRWQ